MSPFTYLTAPDHAKTRTGHRDSTAYWQIVRYCNQSLAPKAWDTEGDAQFG